MQVVSQWTIDFENQIDTLRSKLKERRDLWPELAQRCQVSEYMLKGVAHNWKMYSKIGTAHLKLIADELTQILLQERDR